MIAPDPELRELLSSIHAKQAQIEQAQNEIALSLSQVTFMLDQQITVASVPQSLGDYAAALAAAIYKVQPEILYHNSRTNRVAHPRQLAIYLMIKSGVGTVPSAEHFGLHHHTSALCACTAVQNRIDTDPAFAAQVAKALESMPRSTIPVHPGGRPKSSIFNHQS
jgi:chromosomal replication initiation ATPase DnaA